MSTNDVGLATERVQCSTETDLQDLHCSTICQNILWKPISCQECETHFCSKCITKWLENHPNQCPLRCNSFVQRPCSKFIARLLAKLHIVCIYQPNGCNEIVSYEALEKHETTCGYQRLQCPHCQREILRKNLVGHQSECPALVAKCDDCKIVYKRAEAAREHSEIICLKKQLRDYQEKTQNEVQQAQDNQTAALVSRGIIADQSVVKRVFIPWMDEIGKLELDRIVLEDGMQMILNEKLFCENCKNILWNPISCRTCNSAFCGPCHPPKNIFQRLSRSLFFTNETKRGRKECNCKHFQEAPAPNDLLTALSKLRVHCAYAPNGCQMILPYFDLEEHESVCEFEMVPCEICQLPLSKRPPIVEHTLSICFREMVRKNPAPIQQQFMQLANATKQLEAENRRLQSMLEELRTRFNTLNKVCVKRNPT